MKGKVFPHQRKTITFRSTKAMDVEKFNEDLKAAPWNVMDTFDTLEDKYEYWKSLFNSVAEKHMPTTFHTAVSTKVVSQKCKIARDNGDWYYG